MFLRAIKSTNLRSRQRLHNHLRPKRRECGVFSTSGLALLGQCGASFFTWNTRTLLPVRGLSLIHISEPTRH
eukprot:7996908-Karenia_brevis.AAC.1